MPHLFEPIKLRGVTLANRVAVSPMCQYSSEQGFASDWHVVHLGSRAIGGAGLVFTEATAVLPEGRISPKDLGIWDDRHIEFLSRIVRFIEQQGTVAGIQLAHAGRKASTRPPWLGGGKVGPDEGGWPDNVWGASPIPFSETYPNPKALTEEGIHRAVAAFAAAARRAREAGFRVIELHAAHGYLLHEFFSPLSNHRTDQYGGSLENRTRIARETITAIRREWPEAFPLFMRISATHGVDGGWQVEHAVEVARQVKSLGVDLIDCSSGGSVPNANIPMGPGYQTPFAERIRREAGIPTGAVGLITNPTQADHVIRSGQADVVVLARAMLRDPYWPLTAAQALGHQISWPAQYLRAAPPGSPERRSPA